MSPREFRQYSFLKLNHIDDNVHNLDIRLWGVLGGIIVTVATVIGSAVL